MTESLEKKESNLIEKVNLINLGFNPWSKYWKRNQTIVYLFSRKKIIKKVLYMHSGVWLGDLLRYNSKIMIDPLRSYWKYLLPKRGLDKITVYTPLYLPLEAKFGQIRRLKFLLTRSIIRKFIANPFILILNDPQANQFVVDELVKLSNFTIFDWSDDFVEFSHNTEHRKKCLETCIKYCKIADIVFTVNDKLRAQALKYESKAFTIRNATNFFSFSSCNPSFLVSENVNYIKTLKNKVGYMGWLNSLRLNVDLLKYVVSKRPDIQFIFMGPKSEDKPLGNLLPRLPNVHILPPVPYKEYIACLMNLDVCILPNKINPHTEGNDPIKIYDYLATGKPIVTTMTAGTEQFHECIYRANDRYLFLKYLDQALSENDPNLPTIRIERAREHSWQKRFAMIETIMEPFIQQRFG